MNAKVIPFPGQEEAVEEVKAVERDWATFIQTDVETLVCTMDQLPLLEGEEFWEKATEVRNELNRWLHDG